MSQVVSGGNAERVLGAVPDEQRDPFERCRRLDDLAAVVHEPGRNFAPAGAGWQAHGARGHAWFEDRRHEQVRTRA